MISDLHWNCQRVLPEGGFGEPPTNATAILCSRKLSCFKAPDGAATTTGVFLAFIQTKLARDAVRLRLPTMHPEDTIPRSKVTDIGWR